MYYDGTTLLNMKDINGNKPELYLCSTNRTAGKTTYFNRLMINRFRKNKLKFGLLYRFGYELDNCHSKFFDEIQRLFFPNHKMESKSIARGAARELILNERTCGYAMAINNADQIKKISHLIQVDHLLFDEYQSENNHYCNDEITKFLSVHKSLARGAGKQVKHLPVYMLSNFVTLLNPYYIELGISNQLNSNTKFLRGNGFVVECTVNDSAASALLDSGVSRAFSGHKYLTSASEKIYLNDNLIFIDKPSGKSQYIATLTHEGVHYAITRYPASGIVYCSKHADLKYKIKIAFNADDHQVNYIMLNQHNYLIKYLKDMFHLGAFRFQDLQCKGVILDMLSI